MAILPPCPSLYRTSYVLSLLDYSNHNILSKGLMIGVELVEDKKSRRPLPTKYFSKVMNETKNRGVLFGNGGFYGNVSK